MLVSSTDPEAPTSPAPASAPPSVTGRCIGPYRLCVELASGGMASVFLAQSKSSSRPSSFMALKVIHPHLSQDPILDFGVASAVGQHHLTSAGILKGKVSYIAPEVLRGDKADRRADVWGMGATAWELLTGKRLFRNPTDIDTLRAVLEDPIQRPSEIRPGLPPAMDEVVLRALAREPAERYQSARELGQALLRASAGDGEVIGLGAVAEWMNELFPTGRQRSRDLLDLVGKVAHARPQPASERLRRHAPPAISRFEPEEQGELSVMRTSYWTPASALPGSERPSRTVRPAFRRYAVPCLTLVAGVFVGSLPGFGWSLPFFGARTGQLSAAEGQARPEPQPASTQSAYLAPMGRPAPTTISAQGASLQQPYVVRVEHDGNQLVLRIEDRQTELVAAPAEDVRP